MKKNKSLRGKEGKIKQEEHNKGFDAVICLKGALPEKYFFEAIGGITLICADGAADLVMGQGLMPDLIIGDLDSLSSKTRESFPVSGIIADADQESNDFEKCIRHAITAGMKSVLVAGFNGGVTEHTLNNWSVLLKYHKSLHICVYHERRYGFITADAVTLVTSPGEKISLIPMYEPVVTTKGLKWELRNEKLRFGEREGLSNRSLGSTVEISCSGGALMVFCDARLPYPPELQ